MGKKTHFPYPLHAPQRLHDQVGKYKACEVLDHGDNQKKFNVIDKGIDQAFFEGILGKEFDVVSPADKFFTIKPSES